MNILVLDTNFVAVDLVDDYESLIWVDRFNECGDFELCTIASSKTLNTFKKDYYLWIQESDHVMIVDTRTVDSDAEDGNKLIITGDSLEYILSRRVVRKQTILTGNFQDGVKRLLDENVISPENEERKIDNFIFEYSDDPAITELTIEAQFTGDNLYDAVVSLCISKNIGFKVTLTDDNKFKFKLYAGVDRSYNQLTNPYIVFSPKFENIVNSNYLDSNANLKTVTIVAGEGEGADRRTLVVEPASGGGSGMSRRELYTDARDISSTTAEGESITEEEYNSQLTQRGSEDLSEHTSINSFDGQVDTNYMYKYEEDFFMGDIVQFADEYGNESMSRVTEFIRSYTSKGFEAYPTFSSIYGDGNYTGSGRSGGGGGSAGGGGNVSINLNGTEETGDVVPLNADTLKGKTAGYYKTAYNLLDNSDFRNPVNQRGITNSTSVAKWTYMIDRWKNGGEAVHTFNLNSNGLTLEANTTILQYLANVYSNDTVLTAAIMLSDETIIIASGSVVYNSDGTWIRFAIKNDSGVMVGLATFYEKIELSIYTTSETTVKWAALYEGKYTAETLPEYMPKGYAQELLECQRYFRKFWHTAENISFREAFARNTTTLVTMFDLNNMRKSPTMTYSGSLKALGAETITGLVPSSNSFMYGGLFRIHFMTSGLTTGYTYLLATESNGFSIEFSADL